MRPLPRLTRIPCFLWLALASNLAVADHSEFLRAKPDLRSRECAPCRELGYVEAFREREVLYEKERQALDKLEARRGQLTMQLKTRVNGTRTLEADVKEFQGEMERIDAELARVAQEESAKGFDEIAVLEQRRATLRKAGKKFAKRDANRLQNLKEKRRNFRAKRKLGGLHNTRNRLLSSISERQRRIAEVDKLPPAEQLRTELEEVKSRIEARTTALQDLTESYVEAKRELIFCISHYRLQSLQAGEGTSRLRSESPYHRR